MIPNADYKFPIKFTVKHINTLKGIDCMYSNDVTNIHFLTTRSFNLTKNVVRTFFVEIVDRSVIS